MERNDGVPLLVGHFVDDPVPCKACIVDNNMDLPLPKFRRLFHQLVDVLGVQHVSWYRQRFPSGLIDGYGNRFGLGCSDVKE